jgi:hypothetical protein
MGCFPFFFDVINFISNAYMPFFGCFFPFPVETLMADRQTGHVFFALPAYMA